jgi:tetratricopeptide (TPR) repeat protein
VFWFRHQLHLRLGNLEDSLKDLDSITDGNRQHLGAYLAKANIYQNCGVTKLAIVNYSQVIKLRPGIAATYIHRANLFESENELVYANEDWKMVRNIDPDNEKAAMNLAIYSFDKQLWEESISALTKLIKLKTHVATSYMFRGRANAFLSRWDDALNDLTRAIQLNPARSDFFLYRGCLLKDRNAAKAIEDLSVSILLNDSADNHAAFYERGMGFSD